MYLLDLKRDSFPSSSIIIRRLPFQAIHRGVMLLYGILSGQLWKAERIGALTAELVSCLSPFLE